VVGELPDSYQPVLQLHWQGNLGGEAVISISSRQLPSRQPGSLIDTVHACQFLGYTEGSRERWRVHLEGKQKTPSPRIFTVRAGLGDKWKRDIASVSCHLSRMGFRNAPASWCHSCPWSV
jgi:hypothetical protein